MCAHATYNEAAQEESNRAHLDGLKQKYEETETETWKRKREGKKMTESYVRENNLATSDRKWKKGGKQ